MALGDEDRRSSSVSGLGVRNGLANRRSPSQGKISAPVSPNPSARVMRIPSSSSIPVNAPPAPEPTPSPEPLPTPAYPDYSRHLTPVSSYSAHSPAGPSGDYFQRSVVAKKKPPPPPPKRIGSQNSGLFVTALYTFDGQNQGDLS